MLTAGASGRADVTGNQQAGQGGRDGDIAR